MEHRIGVLGGTFDPVHWGHLFIADYFCDELKLDKLIWIPAYISPLKNKHGNQTSVEHRVNMLQLAIKNNPEFVLDTFEVTRKSTSYSIDTVRYLKKEYKNSNIFLLIGEDNARVFDKWKDPENILSLANVVAYGRNDTKSEMVEQVNPFMRSMQFLNAPAIDISSSEIRRRIRLGKTVKYFLPEKVTAYIEEHSIYS